MTFSQLIEKLALGQPLTATEQQELVLRSRQIELAEQLFVSLIKPGTKTLAVEGLEANNAQIGNAYISDVDITDAQIVTADITDATITAVGISNAVITDATITDATFTTIEVANAQISINEWGVFIANQEGLIGFESTTGDPEGMAIYSDGGDSLVFKNQTGGEGMTYHIDTALHNVLQMLLHEDPAMAERFLMYFTDDNVAGKGAKILLGDSFFAQAHGAAGGWAGLGLHSTSTPTESPTMCQVYFKANKLIFRYLDGATIRYKYLDLTGTGVTWVHSTTAP